MDRAAGPCSGVIKYKRRRRVLLLFEDLGCTIIVVVVAPRPMDGFKRRTGFTRLIFPLQDH